MRAGSWPPEDCGSFLAPSLHSLTLHPPSFYPGLTLSHAYHLDHFSFSLSTCYPFFEAQLKLSPAPSRELSLTASPPMPPAQGTHTYPSLQDIVGTFDQ